MLRFLKYSLDKNKRIRAVLFVEGKLIQKPITVLGLQEKTATLLIGAKKKPQVIALCDILSCDYARGDNGEE